MTERRPATESIPDFVERQIQEALARGDFDGLPGQGQPLEGIGEPDDELWWVRRKLQDEQLTDLPPALRARRDRDETLAAVAQAPDEVTVRRLVVEVNRRIGQINRTVFRGPPTSVGRLDVERVVADWRAAHPDAPYDRREVVADEPAPQPSPRRRLRWFRWRRG